MSSLRELTVPGSVSCNRTVVDGLSHMSPKKGGLKYYEMLGQRAHQSHRLQLAASATELAYYNLILTCTLATRNQQHLKFNSHPSLTI